MTRILEVSNVSKAYGGVKANEDISLSIEQGSIVGLIGPNGSGKTTLY
jgi:ABC-type branched-chain amino acid transport systems, ATPase component